MKSKCIDSCYGTYINNIKCYEVSIAITFQEDGNCTLYVVCVKLSGLVCLYWLRTVVCRTTNNEQLTLTRSLGVLPRLFCLLWFFTGTGRYNPGEHSAGPLVRSKMTVEKMSCALPLAKENSRTVHFSTVETFCQTAKMWYTITYIWIPIWIWFTRELAVII